MHEKSVTFPLAPDQWINTPGVFEGRDIEEDEAMELYLAGKLKPLGPIFPDVQSAERAAEIRSLMFNEREELDPQAIMPEILSTIHWPYR